MKTTAVSLMLLFISSVSAFAMPITVPTDLSPGDQYRLAFVSSGKIDATSSNIADYNSFVQSAADAVPELLALGATWNTIASTAAVDAWDNTETRPTKAGGSLGVPIFLLTGAKLVDSNDDLWDGTLDQMFNSYETGVVLVGDHRAWTGGGGQGAFQRTLGAGHSVIHGDPLTPPGSNDWLVSGSDGKFAMHRLYALSSILTVSAANPIPEPSTFTLFGIAVVAVLSYSNYRLRNQSG